MIDFYKVSITKTRTHTHKCWRKTLFIASFYEIARTFVSMRVIYALFDAPSNWLKEVIGSVEDWSQHSFKFSIAPFVFCFVLFLFSDRTFAACAFSVTSILDRDSCQHPQCILKLDISLLSLFHSLSLTHTHILSLSSSERVVRTR